MKTSETRAPTSVGPGDITGARSALTRGLRLHEEDGNVDHLLTGVETALAHLGVAVEDEEG